MLRLEGSWLCLYHTLVESIPYPTITTPHKCLWSMHMGIKQGAHAPGACRLSQGYRKASCWLCIRAKMLQSCPTLCDPVDCTPARRLCPWDSPGMNNGAGCQARGSFQPRDRACISYLGRFFATCTMWEASCVDYLCLEEPLLELPVWFHYLSMRMWLHYNISSIKLFCHFVPDTLS